MHYKKLDYRALFIASGRARKPYVDAFGWVVMCLIALCAFPVRLLVPGGILGDVLSTSESAVLTSTKVFERVILSRT